MKIETYLNAMLSTADPDKYLSHSPSRYLRAQRQYHAFRNRIIKVNKEKDKTITELRQLIWDGIKREALHR